MEVNFLAMAEEPLYSSGSGKNKLFSHFSGDSLHIDIHGDIQEPGDLKQVPQK